MEKIKGILNSLIKKSIVSVFILFFASYTASPISLYIGQDKINKTAAGTDALNNSIHLLVGDLIAKKISHHMSNKAESGILIMKMRALIEMLLYKPEAVLFVLLGLLIWVSAGRLPDPLQRSKAKTGFKFLCSGLSPPVSVFF